MKYITPFITAHDSQFLSSKNTGLGNVLFQIASCYGISKILDINITFNNVKLYCDILYDRFNLNHKDTILRNLYYKHDLTVHFNMIKETSDYNRKYDYQLIHSISQSTDNHIIWGYLESFKYFDEYINDIQDLFSIDEKSYNIIIEKYGNLLCCNVITPISIHFRGNEHLYIDGINYDYDYYNRAINYMIKNVKNPYFLLFTDDIKSIDFNKLYLNNNYTHIVNEYDYLDLWTISLCKHNIVSTSTFSCWGAFLNKNNDKIVLCNKTTLVTYSQTRSLFLKI